MASDDKNLALQRLGFNESRIQELLHGNPVAFELPGTGGVVGIARILESRLQIGILTINNPGKGLIDFLIFEAKSEAAARAIGVNEIELFGAEIANPDLREVLLRGGFQSTRIEVPADLGGGEAEALSRVSVLEADNE